jgi:arylsulfatase A-like enzyme
MPRPGRTDATLVQTLDLAPTIFARASLAIPTGLPGQSLLPLLGIGPGTYVEHDVYSVNNTHQMSGRTRHFKVDHTGPDGGPFVTTAFDLDADPLEVHPLAAPPDAALALSARLDTWWTARAAEAATARGSGRDDAALRKALVDNGYWGVVNGDTTGTGGRAAPAH